MQTRVLLLATLCCAAPVEALAQLIHGRQLEPIQPGESVQPLRYATFARVHGNYVLTSEWLEFDPRPTTRGLARTAYDCLEVDPNSGTPMTDCPPFGCAAIGEPCESYFYLGPDFHNPLVAADFANARPEVCDGVAWAWWWGADAEDSNENGIPDEQCYIAVSMFEQMNTGECRDSGSDSSHGVILNFGILDARTSDFYYFYLYPNAGFEIVFYLPSDGEGGIQILFGRDFNPTTLEFTLATHCQPVLYATDDDEPPGGSFRPGTQNARQIDDVNPTDGVLDVATECFAYLTGGCPTEVGPAIAFFYALPAPCTCPDFDETGETDFTDLGILLSEFGRIEDEIEHPCVDSDRDLAVGLYDLAVVLSNFGRPCP